MDDEVARLRGELERANDALRFVERWANHHAQKPRITPQEVLSVIQHYPPIKAITASYADGKVPETRDPWAEVDALRDEIGERDDMRAELHQRAPLVDDNGDLLPAIDLLRAVLDERDALRALLERVDVAMAAAEWAGIPGRWRDVHGEVHAALAKEPKA